MLGRLRPGTVILIVAMLIPATVHAARPILDYHRLDAYFALFASDSNVPWKSAAVRVDTYTDAPLDFSAYSADPADVIVAGSNAQTRPLDTRRLTPIVRWKFTPPAGYRFQSSTVNVPLGSREGFFVIEGRRGDIGEQIWINRTRIGLLTKETPASIALFGTDLGTGEPLPRMRVSFLVGRQFIDRFTDRNGLIAWRAASRPSFALARWGRSAAFVSFLPQPQLPRTILAIKTNSAVLRAGEIVHAVGFGRLRMGASLHPSRGDVQVSLRSGRAIVARARARFDTAGAFAVDLAVPQDAVAGNYTVLADANGATAAAGVWVESSANGVSLRIRPLCDSCDAHADVPVDIEVTRNGQPFKDASIAIDVIRSPHALMDEAGETWGMASWFRTQIVSNENGHAEFQIPHPSDELSSTYGIRATVAAASAQTRLVVSGAPVALGVILDRTQIGVGSPATFAVVGRDLRSGRPAAGLHVLVQLIHGASIQQQSATLDPRGYAKGSFSAPEAGFSLIVASAQGDSWRATDAAQLQTEAQAMQSSNASAGAIALAFDRDRYVAGESIAIRAQAAGSSGVVLFTLESAGQTEFHQTPIRSGIAQTNFRIPATAGRLWAGAALVRDGALQSTAVPVSVDSPGRPIETSLLSDRSAYVAGAAATVQLDGVEPGWGTVVVRITQNAPSGAALFEDAPELLSFGTTATQSNAMAGSTWHSWVSSSGTPAFAQTFARRGSPPPDLTMSGSEVTDTYWKVWRAHDTSFEITAPQTPGRYEVSVLKINDDGRVAAGSGFLVVEARP